MIPVNPRSLLLCTSRLSLCCLAETNYVSTGRGGTSHPGETQLASAEHAHLALMHSLKKREDAGLSKAAIAAQVGVWQRRLFFWYNNEVRCPQIRSGDIFVGIFVFLFLGCTYIVSLHANDFYTRWNYIAVIPEMEGAAVCNL